MYYVFRSTTLYLSNHEAEYTSKRTPTKGQAVLPRRQSNESSPPVTETRAEAAEVGNHHVLHIHVK